MNKKIICLKEDGCRLTDLGMRLDYKQTFERSEEIMNNSRSVAAALKAGWIAECDPEKIEKTVEVKKGRGRPKKIQNVVINKIPEVTVKPSIEVKIAEIKKETVKPEPELVTSKSYTKRIDGLNTTAETKSIRTLKQVE